MMVRVVRDKFSSKNDAFRDISRLKEVNAGALVTQLFL
jgi:hypothetical protein